MALPNLFERVVQALFGGAGGEEAQADRQLIADLIEMVVDTVEPRVRMQARYREKLQGCMAATIAHLRALGRTGFEPLTLSRSSWSDNQRVNAFFARPDDVAACLGGSRELRAFFDNPANAGVEVAFALMGMKKVERTIFAPRLKGDVLEHDVPQQTVGFSGHRIVACSGTELEARREVGRLIIRRLAQATLSRIIALDEKATELHQHKAYLGARLRLLNLSRDGVQAIIEAPAGVDEQIKALEKELNETVDDYIETKGSISTLDSYLEQIAAVFGHPEEHVTLTHTPLRLTRMGIKVDETSPEPVNELVLAELSLAGGVIGVITMVRCPRAELPPKEDLIAKAARYL